MLIQKEPAGKSDQTFNEETATEQAKKPIHKKREKDLMNKVISVR